jgi:hypothetical protein
MYAAGPAQTSAHNNPRDPLQAIKQAFPKTIEFKNNGRLLEFCPDNTCHGFAKSENVPVAALKDFAYLYIYFFSDYLYLDDWRKREDANLTAENILSKPIYHNCQREDRKESARCILLGLSRDGKIKLKFIRYDEKERNVADENISEQLSAEKTQSQN